MKNFYLILLIGLSFVSQALGQGVIRGTVLDEGNLPLPGATVTVEALNQGTVADINGVYILQNVPEGTHEVTISYIGYKALKQTVEVSTGATAVTNIQFKQVEALNEVVVWGYGGSQAKALNQQKNANNIVNVISADQVGRFPDSNIGDAMKRVPGVYVQYDQGEARFANIRGTSPELNSVTINGERVPSAEAEDRSVQLDLIPSDMVQAVEVSKAVTPDMDADAIGGSVNLVTRAAPSTQRISATLGSGYNTLSGKAMLNGSLVYGNRFADDKLGVIFSGSVFNHHLGSDNVEAEWKKQDDGSMLMDDFQVRQYYLQRLRQSYSATLDYKLGDNHTIYLKGMYNHRNDWENRYRLRYKDMEYNAETGEYTAEVRRQTKGGASDINNRRLEDQRVYNVSLSGDHLFFGKLKADWSTSYSKASEERPNERYISVRQKDQVVTMDLSDENAPMPSDLFGDISGWDLKDLEEANQYTEEEKIAARLNLMLTLTEGEFSSKIKFGGKYKAKSKLRDNKYVAYAPLDEDGFLSDALSQTTDISKDNYLAGDYQIGTFVSEEFLGKVDFMNQTQFEGEDVLEEIAGNFDAKENVAAGYVMLDQQVGKMLSFIVGVRMEHTALEYSGVEWKVDAEGEESITPTEVQTDSYTNILPSFHTKLTPFENAVVRFAWTNTIARPRYFDLVPYTQINYEDSEVSVGNSALMPTKSMNFDLLGEYYFKSVGIVSGGIFYKDISDFIVGNVSEVMVGTEEFEQTQPINGGDATILGVELGLQRKLDFLPAPFNKLSVYSNYTYTDSKVDNFQIEDRENEDLTLPGTAKHAFNASLVFDSKKFSASVSLNTTSDFVDEFGGDASEDRYYDKVTYLDANASYIINEKFRVYAEANNLLNQPLRYYQGATQYVMQSEFYGPRFSFGLKFDL